MKGIMFRSEMLSAIQNNIKTVTRRLGGLKQINQEPNKWRIVMVENKAHCWGMVKEDFTVVKPRYYPGEIVYIKEAWATEKKYDHLKPSKLPDSAYIHFISLGVGDYPVAVVLGKLRSPRFLPEEFARYFIKIKEVRPERLQEITLQDCWDEGIRIEPAYDRIDAYQKLWDSINSKQKWDTNPWVWRIEFERVERP